MEDIKIDLSKDDESRKELLWEDREETLLNTWKDEMGVLSRKHRAAGKKYKAMYNVLGVPATLIPIVLSGVTEYIHPPVQSFLMIIAGTLVGLSTFFNLGKRFTQHFEYEHTYDELARELEKELRKPKRHRVACDVYMERIYLKYTMHNNNAPNI